MTSLGMLAVLLLAGAGAQPAEDTGAKTRAGGLFREGNVRLSRGDFEGALEKYDAAYEIFPSAKILLNMGTALQGLERWAHAANAYERYRTDPAAESERIAEVSAILARLDAKVGGLRISVDQPDAEVRVDGEPARFPAAVRVEPGAHVVTAMRPGVGSTSQNVTVVAGQVLDVPLTLDVARTAAAGSAIPSAPESPSAKVEASVETAPAIGWTWIGVGAALLATGVVMDFAPSTARDREFQGLDLVPIALYLAGVGAVGIGVLGQEE